MGIKTITPNLRTGKMSHHSNVMTKKPVLKLGEKPCHFSKVLTDNILISQHVKLK
jgi:hypothetical protein